MLCGIGELAVSYNDLGGMSSLVEISFGMTLLATLLPSLGWAKLVRQSWIWIPRQSFPLRGIVDWRLTPVWAFGEDLDYQHATLLTERAFPQ